ncbi:Lactoylglutathione lyase / glyoxalase I family protein [Striga hermonthica]|uniref:Lactoylglutathione lyase / glyoxalase I family protein n=1 Tax=Striga hermonthica TaxID=68872 RepID=A0A9N7MRB0_STRHE|nr:Lactoylglutathione lyase / glyoxalase I family protein [Striga hermonthica]
MVTEITVAGIEEDAISNNTTNINIGARGLPFLSLNHVSFVCKSVDKSVEFYEQVLGFVLIKRPSSFDFEGAWLFNHGIGIHLLGSESVKEKKGKINPKDNHISFQCSDMDLIVHQLENMKVEYITAVVKEGGIIVDQIFFHDPDGYMIEICNCQNLPVLPISSFPLTNNMSNHNINLTPASAHGRMKCSGEVEALMIENLALDMINISI